MNLDGGYLGQICAAAREYDRETDPARRVELGHRLDELADRLSEGQLKQAAKAVARL